MMVTCYAVCIIEFELWPTPNCLLPELHHYESFLLFTVSKCWNIDLISEL